MANETYNVFELTNALIRESREKEAQSADKKVRPTVKESVSGKKVRSKKARKPFEIPFNKLKLESLSMFKEADGDDDDDVDAEVDVTADYTPEDDVVLVIDPEMEEVPEDAEAAAEAAEQMVGDHVCKCSICGANYVTDTEITEETEIEDAECPVCGETGDQIVVGVITPVGELSDEDAADLDDVDVEEEDEEDFDDFEDEDFGDEDFAEEDEEDEYEESLSRARNARRAMAQRRNESAQRRPARPARPTMRKASTRKPATEMADGYAFDEVTFNRMLTQFAKENYANVRSVKITNGNLKRGRLTLEGTVTTTKGKQRTIKFVAEDFKPSARMTIKFREIGPFTESVKSDKPSFILECRLSGKAIRPMALRYSFVAKNATNGVRESKARYSVTGKVLSESLKRTATPTRRRRTRK